MRKEYIGEYSIEGMGCESRDKKWTLSRQKERAHRGGGGQSIHVHKLLDNGAINFVQLSR